VPKKSSKIRGHSPLALLATKLGRRSAAERPGGTLVAGRAKQFLVELANLQDEPEAVERFRKLHGALFYTTLPLERAAPGARYKVQEGFDFVADFQGRIFRLRNWLHAIWKTDDPLTRERASASLYCCAIEIGVPGWHKLGLEDFAAATRFGQFYPQTELEEAVSFLLRSLDRLRVCHNGPPKGDCVAPFFLASRRNQQFCSDACAAPAQRQHKLRWWRQHGEQWRKRRAKKAERTRRTKRR